MDGCSCGQVAWAAYDQDRSSTLALSFPTFHLSHLPFSSICECPCEGGGLAVPREGARVNADRSQDRTIIMADTEPKTVSLEFRKIDGV